MLAAAVPLSADDPKPKPAAAKPKEATAPAAPALFDLRVIGPDDKPIPDAKVNLYTQPNLDKVRLRAGTVWHKPRFGVNLRPDADGRVIAELPPNLTYLSFEIRKPGFGYYSSWWNFQNNPKAVFGPVTARLPRAWTIGGIVVDGEGKPVPNARVTLQVKLAGMGQTGFSDRLWTNSKGIWRFESVPESMSGVTAEVSEPKFMIARPVLERKEFELKAGAVPTAKITLKAGLTVTGKVTDEDGKPIAKALVRARFGNDTRSAFADKSGVYQLEGCEPESTRIVASAKGRVASFREVEVGPRVGPVDFRLKPGGTIRLRVLDEKGHPAAKMRVFVQQWREGVDPFQFDRAPRETDVDGTWEWNEAPPGELTAYISRPRGMAFNRPVWARKEEYVFRVPSELVISGKVVDAETKEPIKSFHAIGGYRWIEGQGQVFWNNVNGKTTPGRYEVRENSVQSAYLVRVVADGYLPAVSRDIRSDEGSVAIDFELLKGKKASLTILTPEGAPAAGAKISLALPNERILVNQGEVRNRGGNAEDREADASGLAQLDVKKDDFWLVCTHRSGYIELAGLSASNPRVIKLAPWARVEGTFQVARKPEADVDISIFRNMFFGNNAPQLTVQSQQQTDPRGQFVFDRMVPGQYQITAKRNSGSRDSEMTTSQMTMIECPAGKTTRVELGSSGRPVTGQLRMPADSKSEIALNSAQIYVRLAGNVNPRGLSYPAFSATPDRDGNFCIDDVPPGDYFLTAFVAGNARLRVQAHRFTVAKVNEKLAQRPVDLGVLTLSHWAPARARKVAAPAK